MGIRSTKPKKSRDSRTNDESSIWYETPPRRGGLLENRKESYDKKTKGRA